MKRILFLLSALLLTYCAIAQKFTNLAATPPMGWNSWNRFTCRITEKIIMETADAMAVNGMKSAGYEYVVIDDCWQVGRDSLGFIIADPAKFPSGIRALADYVHSKGLKFGVYTCAGRRTCQGRPGSRGHEFQDAIKYAEWGVDFLKMDWCNSEGQNAEESYRLMRDAMFKAGRPVLFSICEWGVNKPWEWAGEIGHMWRTTGDIRDNWNIPDAKEGKCWGGGVIINLDMQQGLEKYAGPGRWNDPDMLEVGNSGLTYPENRAHFSLWCMLAAPLMAGNDLRNISPEIHDILTNQEVIAIDQDRLGKQGYKIRDLGEIELFYKPLENNDIAICIFNRFDYPVTIELNWQTLDLKTFREGKEIKTEEMLKADPKFSFPYSIRDLWDHKITGTTQDSFKCLIGGHDVKMLRLIKN